jgi:hypothetical protein
MVERDGIGKRGPLGHVVDVQLVFADDPARLSDLRAHGGAHQVGLSEPRADLAQIVHKRFHLSP